MSLVAVIVTINDKGSTKSCFYVTYANKHLTLGHFLFTFFFLIYLFLAALGLSCCTLAFSSCGEQGLLFVAVCELLLVVASLVVEHEV